MTDPFFEGMAFPYPDNAATSDVNACIEDLEKWHGETGRCAEFFAGVLIGIVLTLAAISFYFTPIGGFHG